MAAYSYKTVVNRMDFQAASEPAMESMHYTLADYDGDPAYDGDCWYVAAFLLEQKDAGLTALRAENDKLNGLNSALDYESKALRARVAELTAERDRLRILIEEARTANMFWNAKARAALGGKR